MGAPTESYVKLSKDESLILSNEQVYVPEFVCVLDDTLLRDVCVTSGTGPGAWLLLNSTKSFDEINELIGPNELNLAKIDATGIAMEILGRPITNTAILGALAKISGLYTLDQLAGALKLQFLGSIADKNINLIKKTYESVDIQEPTREYDEEKAKKIEWGHLEPQYIGADEVPIGAPWYVPGGSEKVNTGGWGIYRIEFYEENCIQCQDCYWACPDLCIIREKKEDGKYYITGTDHFHCKGCRLCVEVCPGKKGVKARKAFLKE